MATDTTTEQHADKTYDAIRIQVDRMYTRRPHLLCLNRTGDWDGAWSRADNHDGYEELTLDRQATRSDQDLLVRLITSYCSLPGADHDLITRNPRFPNAVELYNA